MTTEMPLVSVKEVAGLSGTKASPALKRSSKESPPAIPETKSSPAIHSPLTTSCQYNEAIRRAVITLRRSDTGEVVTQFPPEKVVNYITALLQELRNLDAKA